MGTMMLANTLNIATVRMQNIDYHNHRSFTKTVLDIVMKDRLRAFYKGLVPQVFAFTTIFATSSAMEVVSEM